MPPCPLSVSFSFCSPALLYSFPLSLSISFLSFISLSSVFPFSLALSFSPLSLTPSLSFSSFSFLLRTTADFKTAGGNAYHKPDYDATFNGRNTADMGRRTRQPRPQNTSANLGSREFFILNNIHTHKLSMWWRHIATIMGTPHLRKTSLRLCLIKQAFN